MKGDETVHPLECGLDKDGDKNYHYTGLTKREHFAAMAMQGLASSIDKVKIDENTLKMPQNIASWAVVFADALIEELNK